jgi:hypothetical protein
MSRIHTFLLTLALLLLTLSMFVHYASANAADKNWLLLAAGEWVSGRRLYTDIFETNPPLIIWLYSVPVFISRYITFFTDYNVLALLGFAILALVIRISVRLVALHPVFRGNTRWQLMFALLLICIFMLCTEPRFFFDREHILLVLTFPYVLRFMPSLAHEAIGRRTRLAIGLLAGIGFCIKPHTIVVFATIQLLYILRERGAAILTSAENLVIYALGSTYLAATYFCTTDYFSVVLPMEAATYSGYSQRANGIFSLVAFLFTLGVSFCDFRPRYRSPLRREVYYFLGICSGYLIYALVNNGWSYTWQPLIGMTRFLAGWVLLEFIWLKRDADSHSLPSKPFVFGIRAGIFNLGAIVLFYSFAVIASFFPVRCEDAGCTKGQMLSKGIEQYHPRTFAFVSVDFYKPASLMRRTGAVMEVRFHHLWMLPEFILSDASFAREHRWILDYVGTAYAEDLNQRKPAVIYVDTSPEVLRGHPGVDLLGYLEVAPGFSDAWKQYRRIGVIDICRDAKPDDPHSEPVKTNCRLDVYGRIAQ